MARRDKNTRIRVIGGQVTFSYRDALQTEFAQDIAHYGTAPNTWKPVFDAFGPYMLRSIDRTFVQEGRPKKWAALKPNTIRQRMRLGFGPGPILQRSGTLRRGFTVSSAARTFRIENIVPYFPYHQFGTRHMAARPMIVLLTQDKAAFTRIARKHLRIGNE